mmetsp:Transcript_27198/g.54399  ORF Transcript_27198/g.54399 Transcript_27198/m.54399 type:complete len:212 (+) Transcript_27198:245-880(+)
MVPKPTLSVKCIRDIFLEILWVSLQTRTISSGKKLAHVVKILQEKPSNKQRHGKSTLYLEAPNLFKSISTIVKIANITNDVHLLGMPLIGVLEHYSSTLSNIVSCTPLATLFHKKLKGTLGEGIVVRSIVEVFKERRCTGDRPALEARRLQVLLNLDLGKNMVTLLRKSFSISNRDEHGMLNVGSNCSINHVLPLFFLEFCVLLGSKKKIC